MAGFLELIDNALGTHFNAPVYDPAKGRAKLVKAIEGAASQHSENRTKVPNRAWTVGNNSAIRYKPTLNGHPIFIGDKEENYVRSEQFGEFLSGFKAAVLAGDFDAQIESALTDGGSSTGTRGGKASVAGQSGRTFTPEGRVNIAMNNRYNKALPDNELEAKLIAGGHDAKVVKAAIAKRKKA